MMMNVEQSMEWELAGETELFGENLPPCHFIQDKSHMPDRALRPCPAWQRRASTCGRALLPHADKHMFVYVLELCNSEAKRTSRAAAVGSRRLTVYAMAWPWPADLPRTSGRYEQCALDTVQRQWKCCHWLRIQRSPLWDLPSLEPWWGEGGGLTTCK
jgi:hypothetical protein